MALNVRKDGLLSALLIVFIIVIVSACSSGGSESQNREKEDSSDGGERSVVLEYLAFAQPQEQEIYEKLFEQFEADYPNVKIDATFLPPDDFWQQMQTRLGAGTQPDV